MASVDELLVTSCSGICEHLCTNLMLLTPHFLGECHNSFEEVTSQVILQNLTPRHASALCVDFRLALVDITQLNLANYCFDSLGIPCGEINDVSHDI